MSEVTSGSVHLPCKTEKLFGPGLVGSVGSFLNVLMADVQPTLHTGACVVHVGIMVKSLQPPGGIAAPRWSM